MSEPQLGDIDLVAVTSHEMRTPLAAIRGFTALLQRRRQQLTDAEVDEFLGVISEQTDRLVRMVDDLLSMSRLETGTMPMDPEPVVLVPFLEDVVAGLAADRVALRVSTDLPASIDVDPMRLRQILQNLLQNALRYAPGAITLAASGDDPVALEVIDHGPGIPAAELDRIFEPFYRATGRTGPDDGVGLGLPITRRLAEAMGGRVTVGSVVGQGSTFRVTIPRRVGAAPVPPSSTA